ncbi:MAG: hypothetical protein AAF485_31530, partial [Chloroflexota bacterium]
MFGRQVIDPELGHIRRLWGNWVGEVRFSLFKKNVKLVIKSQLSTTLEGYLKRVKFFVNNFDVNGNALANQLFEDYNFYKEMDIQEGNLSEKDLLRYPKIATPQEIWKVLSPYELRVGDTINDSLGNAYLLCEINWPNPHYFQVYLQLECENFT